MVNKVGAVENEFRVLPMELIAGEPTTMVEVPESGCVFKFDFKDVFWNSRLQGEHQRIVKLVGQKDLVCTLPSAALFPPLHQVFLTRNGLI